MRRQLVVGNWKMQGSRLANAELLSGLLAAARHRLDAVGVCVVAGLAAFGGGTLRDVLLDRRPFFWVEHAGWLWGLLALCIGAMFFLRRRHFELTERAIQWPDALGLGLFTASGTQLALGLGLPAIVAVLMGMVTAVFGGVLRDIVCNQIPSAFSDHRPYAVCSFLGGWVLVGGLALGWTDWVAVSVAAGLTSAARRRPGWGAAGCARIIGPFLRPGPCTTPIGRNAPRARPSSRRAACGTTSDAGATTVGGPW